MSVVTLVSGGTDSTLMALLVREEGITQYPLFIDYGQMCVEQELNACVTCFDRLGLPKPSVMNVSGYGRLIPSGLTNSRLRVNEDAFLPGRNLLFLLVGAAYGYQFGCQAVAIGLLSEGSCLFPDQTSQFVKRSEELVSLAFGRSIKIVTPLMTFNKRDVLDLAEQKGITGTYSCHSGHEIPCGRCVSCVERETALAERGR